MNTAEDWAAHLSQLPQKKSIMRKHEPRLRDPLHETSGIVPPVPSFPDRETWEAQRAVELMDIYQKWYTPITQEQAELWAEDDYLAEPEEIPIHWRWQRCHVCGKNTGCICNSSRSIDE